VKVTRHFARRFRLLTLLRTLLGTAGALFAVAAVLALAAPGVLARNVGAAFLSEPLAGWLFAALLAPLGGSFFLAARDPRRYSGVIILAVAALGLFAVALGAGALGPGGGGLWLPAGTALALALATAAAWLPLRI
jgi:hypothetical protein